MNIPRVVLPMSLRPWLGGIIISFSGVWVRLADVEATRTALLRTVYALPVLALLVLFEKRRAPEGGDCREGGRASGWVLPIGVVAGFLLAIDLIAWHASIAILGAGLGSVLPNLQVIFVGIAGVLLFRERPRRGFWAAIPLVLVGVALVGAFGRSVSVEGSVALGVALGVTAAIFYAASLVLLRVARGRSNHQGGAVVLFSMTLGAAIVSGIAAAVEGVAGPAGWPADGWLLLLAIGSQVIGWSLLTSSIAHLPAALTSVALLTQPVLALMWGAALLSEPVSFGQVGGAVFILLGVLLAHRAIGSGDPRGRAEPRGAIPVE